MTFKKSLVFALIVTLAAQTLDIMVHLATDVAVHLPYIAVKEVVIFFTIVLFTYWVGINWKDGLVGSFAASFFFDIYYTFAEPTLDRTIFTLDEAAYFILLHFFCIAIPYLLTWKYLTSSVEGIMLSSRCIWWRIVVPGIIIGSLFTFPSRQFLKAYPYLKLGLSYNDHVLIGTLAFIAAVVALYKWIFKKSITN